VYAVTPRRNGRGPRPETSRAIASVRIDDLAPGGAGVGHALVHGQRRAIFVPRVALGDELEVEVDATCRPARGRVIRLLAHGPGRVPAPCAFVESCGACDWMHLSRAAQAEAREQHLRRALPAQLREFPALFHDESESLAYRTRARLHVRASGGRAIVGFHGVRSHEVVEIGACVVLAPALDAAIGQVASLLEGAHGEGDAQIALGSGGKPVIELVWHGRVAPASFGRLEQGVAAGIWAGGRVHLDGTTRPAVVGDPAPQMTGADGLQLRLAAGGFAQASDAGNVVLATRVLELAKGATGHGHGSASVLELYAGAGNFTILLARAFGRVVAVESDSAACDAARGNLAARGLVGRVTCADAESFTIPPRTDLVVLDPPRRGAKAASIALAASSVKAIVYVSCDAPTLGRDLAILGERFEPVAIESFAMFPGTSHSETVVALRRLPRGRRTGTVP
jgi:23S rRNA (uracil1939-C5)-methyltransferase